KAMLGLVREPQIDYVWHGVAAVTPTRLPGVVRTRDGVVAATACNGRGIALATVAGEAIADALIDDSLRDLPLPLSTGPERPAPVRLQQMMAGFYPYAARVSDWIDRRR
ncbi:MAG: hypothetical protein WEB93_04695, partial [Sphingomonadales bacterium]